jgi:hypothetical protein
MEVMSVVATIGGILLSVIGWFLKRTMEELKEVKSLSLETSTKLKVLEKQYTLELEYLTDKFDDLNDTIKDLIKEIKNLNDRIK